MLVSELADGSDCAHWVCAVMPDWVTVAGHQVVMVLPFRGTLRVFTESFEAGLAQQALTPCCSGVVGVLPVCLDRLRGLNTTLLTVQVKKAKRTVRTVPCLCFLCLFFFPCMKPYK